MKVRDVEPRPHAALLPPRVGDVLVTADVGPRGEAVALWSTEDGKATLQARRGGPGGATFPETRPPKPVAVRLTRHSARGDDAVVEVDALTVAHPHIQPLPDGQFLVVGGRCAWTARGPEHNARVIDGDGNTVAAAVFGDGIEHLCTTPSGHVWVGYFDEGVVGNFGWGGPDGPEPIGSAGLVQFDTQLNRVWTFPADKGHEPITDCYALNVTDEDAWLCYYTGFPVMRVSDGELSEWSNTATGATAIIADGKRCALVGGYEQRNRVLFGELTGCRFRIRRTFRLMAPRGPWRAIGRGATLHVLTDTTHCKLDLDHLALLSGPAV